MRYAPTSYLLACLAALLLLSTNCTGDGSLEGISPTLRPHYRLQNATGVSGRPEIGELVGHDYCTATLVAPRWVLTAAHCISFNPPGADPASYQFSPGSLTNPSHAGQNGSYKGAKVLNFGPPCCSAAGDCCTNYDLSQWTTGNINTTADRTGTNDIALVLLAQAVPESIVPASIATVQPVTGTTVTQYGYATDEMLCATWQLPVLGPPGRADVFIINSDGTLQTYAGNMTGGYNNIPAHMQQGDSGGPLTLGSATDNGAIWGVNSSIAASAEYYGSVAYLSPYICSKMFAEEPHSWCVPGAPMIVPVRGCTDTTLFTEKVVTYVCSQAAVNDNPSSAADLAKCCDPSSSGIWGSTCISVGAKWASAQGLGNGDLCGRNAWAQGPIAGTQQKYPRDFNLFTLGDATNFPDVAGAAAVGGQFTASSFSLNFSGYAAVGLVDSGLAQLANGKVSGSIYSPNLATFPTAQLTTLLNSVTVVNGSSTQTTSSTQVIEFANAFVNLRNMSQVLKLYTNTPPLCVLGACIPTVVIGSDTIVITGTRADLVVATIDSAKLSAVSTVNINIGPGTRLIVNVTGGSASFGPMQVNWKNGTSNILWNFPDATEIDMKAVRFGGSVLAPNAVVKFDWGGDIVGTLVAKSAGPLLPSGQSFQLHSMPFPWPM